MWAIGIVFSLVVVSGVTVTALIRQGVLGNSAKSPVVTEIVASNGLTLTDEDGDTPDWFEIMNPHRSPISLNRFGVVTGRGQFWSLPSRLLEPGEHLVIFASGKDRSPIIGELHTSFRLPQSGGFLGIYDKSKERVVEGVTYPGLPRNASWGLAGQTWCFFAFPTPSEPNPDECLDSDAPGEVTFSHEGGFYSSPFRLELSAPSADDTLLYTLDGSYPDREKNPDSTRVYSGPIEIKDPTPQPPRWADIDATIPNDIVPTAITPPTPDGDIPKVTTVRARLVNGEERAETFIIGPGTEDFELPILSLMVDGDCLFDNDTGIYIAGSTFFQALEEGRFDPLDPGRAPLPANYLESGSGFECPGQGSPRNSAWLQVCQPDQKCFESEPSRLRIHGGWTRANPQKSLRLYSQHDGSGNRNFAGIANLNNDFEGYPNLILRMSGGNEWTHWDDFLQSLVSDFSFDTQSSEPAAVFLNGEYWGLYNIRHRYDRHFIERRHGVNQRDVRMLGADIFSVQEGPDDSEDHFLDVLRFLRDNDPRDSAVVELVHQKIDMAQFYDVVALNLFVGNTDWPHNNVRVWREAPPDAEPSIDGEGSAWRFLVFDLDAGGLEANLFERRFAVPESWESQGGLPFLFHRMMENPAERETFLNRFADLMNTTFHPDRTVPQHADFVSRVEPEMDRQIRRWGQPSSLESWQSFIAQRNERLKLRPDEQRQILVDWFELDGISDVVIELPDSGATVTINDLVLTNNTPGILDSGNWAGRYFSGIPVRVSTQTDSGFELANWVIINDEGLETIVSGEEVVVEPGRSVTIRPILNAMNE